MLHMAFSDFITGCWIRKEKYKYLCTHHWGFVWRFFEFGSFVGGGLVLVCFGGFVLCCFFLSGQEENSSLLQFCNGDNTAFLINSGSAKLPGQTFFQVLCLNLNKSNIILTGIYLWVNLIIMVVMLMFLMSIFCLREPIMVAKLKSNLVLLWYFHYPIIELLCKLRISHYFCLLSGSLWH